MKFRTKADPDAALLEQLKAEMISHAATRYELVLTVPEVLAIVGMIQLALRHPFIEDNHGARAAQGVVDQIAVNFQDAGMAQANKREGRPVSRVRALTAILSSPHGAAGSTQWQGPRRASQRRK